MKKIAVSIVLIVSILNIYAQVPANDVCSGAIALPAINLISSCNSTTQPPIQSAWTSIVHGNNFNSNHAIVVSSACPPPNAPNDVWYSIVMRGTILHLNISNIIGFSKCRINLWSSLSNGGCNATDFVLNDCQVINGNNDTITFSNALIDGKTYYIQISGNDGSEFGSFDISASGERTCGNCVQQGILTATPAPVNGYYAPGQIVNFKLEVNGFHQMSNNWFHGVAIENIGNGWVENSITPITAPNSCDGNGRWRWYTSVSANSTGKTFGPGFFYDQKDDNANYDNNPGNNYGDNCTNNTWTFEWSLKVRGCPFSTNTNNLSFTVNTLGDGESGAWENNDCYNDIDYKFLAYSQPNLQTTFTITNAGCQPNGSISAVINGGNPNYSYLWNTGVKGTTDGNSSIVLQNIPAAEYSLKITDANNCISNSKIRVSADTTFPAANAGKNKIITCSNPIVKIGTEAISGYSYSWSPAIGLSDAKIATPTTSTSNIYTLTVTNPLNSCSSISKVKIEIDTTKPIANAGINQTLTCKTPILKIGTPAINGNTYSWLPNAGLSDPHIAQPTTNTMNNYTVTVTNTANGCSNSDTVIIFQKITSVAAIAGANKTITCNTKSFEIGTPAIPGYRYSWSPAEGLSNASTAQPTAFKPGKYLLTVTDSVSGCTATDITEIAIDTLPPIANAGKEQVINCSNTFFKIGTLETLGYSYLWSPKEGLSDNKIAQPIATKEGTYTLIVTKNATGCSAKDIVNIGIDTLRPVANAGEDQYFDCPHRKLVIGTPNEPNLSYKWTNGLGLDDYTIAQPNADSAGTFVLVTTNTINHCKSAPDSVVLFPKNCACEFYVPTAFTPNNDGINDILAPLKGCDDYRDFSFSIYNRWGELVFKSDNIQDGWNGSFKNEIQQIDSYVWILEYFDVFLNEKRKEKGIVSLLK